MSIAQALGYADEQIFKRIPEERIRNFGNCDNEQIGTSFAEAQIFAENEEDKKVLEEIYGLRKQ